MSSTQTNCPKCGAPQIGGTWCRGCGQRLEAEAPSKSPVLANTLRVAVVAIFALGWYLFHRTPAPPPTPVEPAATIIYPSQSGVLNKAMSMAAASNADKSPTGVGVFNQAAPSVVTLFRDQAGKHEDVLGAGFLLDDTTVATNYHVVNGVTSMSAHFSDGTFRKVKALLGYNQDQDVILLRIDSANPEAAKKSVTSLEEVTRQLKSTTGQKKDSDPTSTLALPIAETISIKIGDTVIAIGSPQGDNGTVQQGIITGMHGSILQTNIPVTPTSSGGPLLNMRGEVVGMLTSHLNAPGVDGLNFALPINWATHLLSSTANRPLDADGPASASSHTFGPYTFKLPAHQKRSLPFTTPKDLTSAQFTANLGDTSSQMHITLMHSGRLLFDDGSGPQFELTLKPGDYVLVIENPTASPHDLAIHGAFNAAH